MATPAAALAARITAAGGDKEFPARIGMSAVALARVAEARLADSLGLYRNCHALNESVLAETSWGDRDCLGDQDLAILAFFLARNTSLEELRCARTHTFARWGFTPPTLAACVGF